MRPLFFDDGCRVIVTEYIWLQVIVSTRHSSALLGLHAAFWAILVSLYHE